MPIFFFDNNASNITAYKRLLEPLGVSCYTSDVRQIQADVFVSPANSYGFMNGGIDAIYSSMFPGVQQTVQSMIAQLGLKDPSHRDWLPVGSAVMVKARDNAWIMCAPTMSTPQSLVHQAQNIYWAMRAILRCSDSVPNLRVAIPCLGTGVGQMSAESSAREVRRAILDHINRKPGAQEIFVAPMTYIAYPLAQK